MKYFARLFLFFAALVFCTMAQKTEFTPEESELLHNGRVALEEKLAALNKEELVQFTALLIEANIAKECKLHAARESRRRSLTQQVATTTDEDSLDDFVLSSAVVEYVFEEEAAQVAEGGSGRRLFVFSAFSGLIKGAINKVTDGKVPAAIVDPLIDSLLKYADNMLTTAYPVLLAIQPFVEPIIHQALVGFTPRKMLR